LSGENGTLLKNSRKVSEQQKSDVPSFPMQPLSAKVGDEEEEEG
jgi:hypothetical protein